VSEGSFSTELGQNYYGNSVIGLRQSFGIDDEYDDYSVQYLAVTATALGGQSTVVLYVDGVAVSDPVTIYGSQTIYITPSIDAVLGDSDIQIYVYGDTYLGSASIQLQ
jgi:hypothetical protein